jgi:Domain of unknown function (DUF4440)
MNDIELAIRRINDAWQSSRVADLAHLFHPEMIIAGPGHVIVARGVEECVASYSNFMNICIIHYYRDYNLAIHERDVAAVATYSWEMEYEQNGNRSRETGSDLFVFQKNGTRWEAIWRSVMFSATEA